MDQQKIGDFISSLRKEKGYTQEQLGNIVGVTGKAVSRWERGLSIPDVSIINKVSEVLGTTTTELLNGEKVVDITKQNLDEITENSVAFYKKKLKQKFKKWIVIIVTCIFFIVFAIQFIFYMNNYDRFKIYSIDSNSAELDMEGLIIESAKDMTIIMSNFKYHGTVMEDVCSVNYDVYLNGEIINTGNIDISSIKDNKSYDIRNFFSYITIYIDNDKKYSLNNIFDFYISFKFISYGGEESNYELPLRIDKKFSNNKLVYSK